MYKSRIKNSKAITLISLIVTIIILIILAGITISMTIGNNGIITRAKQGKQNYEQSIADEEKQLNELYEYIMRDDLPENNRENQQDIGKIVKLPDEWAVESVKYISTKTGLETSNVNKVATVYAVSVGEGNTVPVPIGFWYVGGTLDTGVVISDREEDSYNKNGKDMTGYSDTKELKGNQFVFIPCTIDSYKKTTNYTKENSDSTWGTKAQNSYYDTSTNSAEKTQIEKYGGFYVGRYETGTSNIQGIDFANINTDSWTSDATNYTKVTSGNVTIKANEIPYNHADYETAVEMSERMYKNDVERNKYVNSGLVTGTMWDVMINVMNKKTGCDLSSSGEWGNYYEKEWNISNGSYCEMNSNGGHGSWVTISSENTYKKAANSRVILSTASNSKFEKYNLYDVAGNLWEWTQEMAFNNNTTESFILRGGSCPYRSGSYPASFRVYTAATRNSAHLGFRVALYLK